MTDVKRYDLAPDHIARVYFDDGGWQWVYLREVGYKWVRFVRLACMVTSERMLRATFDGRVLEDSVRPASGGDLERWQQVTSAWREPNLTEDSQVPIVAPAQPLSE